MSFHLILKIDANTESSRSGILNRKATGRLSTQIPIGKSFYLGELSKKLPLLGENVIYINLRTNTRDESSQCVSFLEGVVDG